jgi:ATPase subunit of ABC transporter with duplicated ATPase domains
MLDLALGVALYAQPPHVKFPGLAAVAIARSLLRKRRRRAETNSTSDSQGKEDDGVEVRWKGLTSALHKKRTRKTKSDADAPRVILSEVSGVARPGRFLALLGPSGSGKTSLLNALAGQTPADEKLRLTGALAFNGVAVDGGAAHRERVAYVRQQDVFYSELTVRETLVNAATGSSFQFATVKTQRT